MLMMFHTFIFSDVTSGLRENKVDANITAKLPPRARILQGPWICGEPDIELWEIVEVLKAFE